MAGPRNPYPTNNKSTNKLPPLNRDPLQDVLMNQIQGGLSETPPQPKPIPESGIALALMNPALTGAIMSQRTQGPEFQGYEARQKRLPAEIQAYGSLAGTQQRGETAQEAEQGRNLRSQNRIEEKSDQQLFDQANKYGVSIYDQATGQPRERSAIQTEIAASSQKARASKQALDAARAAHLRALDRWALQKATKTKGKHPDPIQMSRYATSIYNSRMNEMIYSDDYADADEKGKAALRDQVFKESMDMADQAMEYYSGVPGAEPKVEAPSSSQGPSGNPLLDAINAERARRGQR